MNRRIRNRTYGGVGAGEGNLPGYPIRCRRTQDGYLPAKFDLWRNMLRDFHAIQDRVKAKRAKRDKVKVAEVGWRLGCLHDLRVSFCTHAAEYLTMYELQEIAGHEDIKTTAQFYTRTTKETVARLRKAMGGSAATLTAGA